MLTAPTINKSVVCITNDFILAAVISSYFQKPSEYFSVFWYPEVQKEPENVIEEYVINFAQVHISNRIRSLKPEVIICAGLSDTQKKFTEKLSPQVISISSHKEIDIRLNTLVTQDFNGELRANKHNLLIGLHLAGNQGKKLVYDPSAPKLPRMDVTGKEGVLVLEKSDDIGAICAVNYALSADLDLAIIKSVTADQLKTATRAVSGKDAAKRDRAKANILKRLRSVPISLYKNAVFCTDGLPYAYAIENSIPSSHVPIRYSPFFIFDNIADFHVDSFGSFLSFSPEEFELEEMDTIENLLSQHQYSVKSLRGEQATSRNFEQHAEYYPYDLLHICTHGGETDGYYVIERINDRFGGEHVIEYYEVVSFRLSSEIGDDGKPMVVVARKMLWRKLDGMEWGSKRLRKNVPDHVFQDLVAHLESRTEDEDNVIRTPVNYPIEGGCYIKCVDGLHQGMFRCLAATSTPIIFNNSCASWSEIAKHTLSMGCKAYIGTLYPIGNGVAKDSAELFYKLCLEEERGIMEAVHEVNRRIENRSYQNIYHYWGLPFTRIKAVPTAEYAESAIFDRLNQSLYLYLKMSEDPMKAPDVVRNSTAAANFLLKILFSDHASKVASELSNAKAELEKRQIESRDMVQTVPPIEMRTERVVHPDGLLT